MRIENYPGAAATLNFQLSSRCKITHLVIVRRIILPQPASTFVKIPIRVVKTFLQAICSRFFPCPLSVSSKYCIMSLMRCCAVLYALCVIFFSHRFPFPKGKTMGKRSNNDRINDDATTIAQRVAEWRRLRGSVVRVGLSYCDAVFTVFTLTVSCGSVGVMACLLSGGCMPRYTLSFAKSNSVADSEYKSV